MALSTMVSFILSGWRGLAFASIPIWSIILSSSQQSQRSTMTSPEVLRRKTTPMTTRTGTTTRPMSNNDDDNIEDIMSTATAVTTTATNNDDRSLNSIGSIPLIALGTDNDIENHPDIPSRSIVNALKSSGFLLITSPHISMKLQQEVIQVTRDIFETGGNKHNQQKLQQNDSSSDKNNNNNNKKNTTLPRIVTHPTDPKKYIMLESLDAINQFNQKGSSSSSSLLLLSDETSIITPVQQQILQTYWNALEGVKRQILTCIAIGLNLPDPNFFVKLHRNNQSALRLLSYPPISSFPPQSSSSEDVKVMDGKDDEEHPNHPHQQQQIIRCKPHSDYGSITLLLTDGVPGLQALIDDKWTMIPHVPGALVVNIGSLLSDWTRGELLATLHRVVAVEPNQLPSLLLNHEEGNNVNNTKIGDNKGDTLMMTTQHNLPRISLAFFADPDEDVAVNLKLRKEDDSDYPSTTTTTMSGSVADYIQWRSGGKTNDVERSGLAYTEEEEIRAQRANNNT